MKPNHSSQSALFLQQLQEQASKQSVLHQTRLLPPQLDAVTSLIGNYPWQSLLVLSGLTAIFLELI